MTRTLPRSPTHAGGFSLIELLIAIAILGIVGTIAYPSYLDSVRKGRRSDGMSALMAVQQAQERWRGNNANYTTNLGDLGVASVSSSGYYDLTITAAPVPRTLATAYVATATGKGGTTQADDTACRKLSVKLEDGNLSYAGCGSCADFSYAPTHLCWAK